MTRVGSVAGLWRYPVKSMIGDADVGVRPHPPRGRLRRGDPVRLLEETR